MDGAFTKSLNERRDQIFFLNQHNFAQPHGKFAVLREDNYGLYFESNPLIDTTYSMDTLKLYEAGIIDKHSIGYIKIKSRPNIEQGQKVEDLTELMLYEGSNVTLPDNPQAGFLGLKNLTLADIETKTQQITKFIRNGNVTDETFRLLDIALLQLKSEAYELGKKALDKNEPPGGTQLDVKPLFDVIDNFKF